MLPIFRTDTLSGMPIAWMVSSNAHQETLTFLLRTIRASNPEIRPKRIMSDKDRAQMNSIRLIYPESKLLLCWWHVLHAWQQHFVTSQHPELWALLKAWVRITDQETFDKQWQAIKEIAPASVVRYLEMEWCVDTSLWSAVACKDCSVLELSDTNMLVEA
jgi:hypothetical protein